jgi:hypothetical protein
MDIAKPNPIRLFWDLYTKLYSTKIISKYVV